jgi:hypothetical protein
MHSLPVLLHSPDTIAEIADQAHARVSVLKIFENIGVRGLSMDGCSLIIK